VLDERAREAYGHRYAQREAVEVERTIGLNKARGKLGQLAEEVRADNAPLVLMRRGEPLVVLVSPSEYERLTEADRRATAEQLQARLVKLRKTVQEAGLDVTVVDEAIAAARAAK
jgi:prevent-host-death family protein